MLLRRTVALIFMALISFLAPSFLLADPAQEAQSQESQQPVVTEEPKPAEPEAARPPLSDRLKVEAGAAYFILSGSTRGTTEYRDNVGPATLQQTLAVGFKSSTGTALKVGASYLVYPRWTVEGELLSASPGSAEMKDQRLINDFQLAGDFDLAEFGSEHDSKFTEWGLGGSFRAFPGKKHQGSRLTIDAVMNYRKAHAEYTFDPGELVSNPFDPNALSPSSLDPYLHHPASSYNMGFETLSGGMRMGGRLSERFTLSGNLEWIWFARFEGYANLGPHGTVFVHNPFGHFDTNFHTYNCNNDADANTPRCLGLVDADLRTTTLKVEQKSSRARGLRVDLNLDVKLSDWFGVLVGYHRQDYRSVGGTEKRLYGDVNPDPTLTQKPVEDGELENASITTQTFILAGRFQLF